MSAFTLVIGNKNFSSWSLRPWLAMKTAGIPFAEHHVKLRIRESTDYLPSTREQILAFSPSAKVPCLLTGDGPVWDSLAICEYLAERFPDKGLWPGDARARAVARCVSAEMHGGFMEVRSQMSMDITARLPLPELTGDLALQVARILDIWTGCRAEFGAGGDFLFGRFSIADAMFAPVVTRFTTFGAPAEGAAKAYMDAIWALPAMQDWKAGAEAEQSDG